MSSNRAMFDQSLSLLCTHLNLQRLSVRKCDDGSTVTIYDWPREDNDTEHDRTIVVVQYPDGSWDEYLSSDELRLVELEAMLRKMVAVKCLVEEDHD